MGTSGLGALLVEEGLLTENDRSTIRRTSGSEGAAFARGVLALGLLDEDELVTFLAEHTRFRVAAKDLKKAREESATDLLDRPLLQRLGVIPLRSDGKSLVVAMPDPLDSDTIRQLEFFTGYAIVPEIATFSQIRRCLEEAVPDYQPPRNQLEDFLVNHAVSATRRQRLTDPKARIAAQRMATRSTGVSAKHAIAQRNLAEDHNESMPQRHASTRHAAAAQTDDADLAFDDLTSEHPGRPNTRASGRTSTPAKSPIEDEESITSASSDAALDDFANDSELLDGDDQAPTLVGVDDPFAAIDHDHPELARTRGDGTDHLGEDDLDAATDAELVQELDSEPSFASEDDAFEGLDSESPAPTKRSQPPQPSPAVSNHDEFAELLGDTPDAAGIDGNRLADLAGDEAENLDAAVHDLGRGVLAKQTPRPRDTDALASIMVSADDPLASEDTLSRDDDESFPDQADSDLLLNDVDGLAGEALQADAVLPSEDDSLAGHDDDTDLIVDADDLIPMAADTALDAMDHEPDVRDDAPAFSDHAEDPLAIALGHTDNKPDAYAVAVNRALLALSLAADPQEAAAAAAPGLAACGLERGVLIRLQADGELTTLFLWQADPRPRADEAELARYAPLSLIAALDAYSPDWSDADKLCLAAGMEHLSRWKKPGSASQLSVCVLPSPSGNKLAAIVMLDPEAREDLGKREAVTTILRSLARAC